MYSAMYIEQSKEFDENDPAVVKGLIEGLRGCDSSEAGQALGDGAFKPSSACIHTALTDPLLDGELLKVLR